MGYGALFAGLGGASGQFSKALGNLMQQRQQWNMFEQNQQQEAAQFGEQLAFDKQAEARRERLARAQMAQSARQHMDDLEVRQGKLDLRREQVEAGIEQASPYRGMGREDYWDYRKKDAALRPGSPSMPQTYQTLPTPGSPTRSTSGSDLRRSMSARADGAARSFVNQKPGATEAEWAGTRSQALSELRGQFPSIDPAIIKNELNTAYDRYQRSAGSDIEGAIKELTGSPGPSAADTAPQPGAGTQPTEPQRSMSARDIEMGQLWTQSVEDLMSRGMSEEEAERALTDYFGLKKPRFTAGIDRRR